VNNPSKWLAGTLLATLLASQAQAAFVLNGTRFIYHGDQNSVNATVRNDSKLTYGGQVWVANATPQAEQTHFIPTPTFFKLGAGQSQVVRILGVQTDELPQDRETLTLLNVQEIPPAPKNPGNAISIAVNTQVKLIYRPQALHSGRKNAADRLRLSPGANGLTIDNPTPYYLAITALRQGEQRLRLSAASDKAMATLAPFSKTVLDERIPLKGLSVETLDDYGAVRSRPAEGQP